MPYSYIARQAILDRQQRVYGYELLFRDSNDNRFPDIHPDEATSKVLLQQHLLGDIETLCMGRQAFINFHTNTLIHHFPSFLNNDNIWIEVLETVDLNPDLIKACEIASGKGYRIALDDHDFTERWDILMPHVHLVKVDIQEQGLDIADRLTRFKQHGVPLLAERVETKEQFNTCLELGFDFFQGFFFEQPEIVRQHSLTPQRISMLNLLSEVFKNKLDFKRLGEIIQQDLSLTYSLLKLVNSPALGARVKIKDIRQALAYLGERELKRFLTLVLLANVTSDKPEELTIKSVTRARFMELLTREMLNQQHADTAFMVGMLSLLDAILGQPMEVLTERLPLSQDVVDALTSRKGVWGHLLHLCELYERGKWHALEKHPLQSRLSKTDIGQHFIDASQWCRLMLV
ncbi:hypothetical protein CWI84_08540 [Idiomarina tyrosinivorans]|uniref:HDOD domain-containing protein n=1 Tax=Idiomarina tyrosinivorans TaxID=1445662 RepID=A0A432ZQ22_9GAMM|nr:HDOD domain-containing protein [Idiomarina tyrosinivorans]RUO79997.1 hypothetical protein CWI84_08540 [Idiomarina tyrosinivorans]